MYANGFNDVCNKYMQVPASHAFSILYSNVPQFISIITAW